MPEPGVLSLKFSTLIPGPHESNKALQAAWWRGWNAAALGEPFQACPYEPADDDEPTTYGRIPFARAWRAGWLMAEEVINDAR